MIHTNRVEKPILDQFQSNADLIEERIKRTDWKPLIKIYLIGLSVFLVTLFSIIATARLALNIF